MDVGMCVDVSKLARGRCVGAGTYSLDVIPTYFIFTPNTTHTYTSNIHMHIQKADKKNQQKKDLGRKSLPLGRNQSNYTLNQSIELNNEKRKHASKLIRIRKRDGR